MITGKWQYFDDDRPVLECELMNPQFNINDFINNKLNNVKPVMLFYERYEEMLTTSMNNSIINLYLISLFSLFN